MKKKHGLRLAAGCLSSLLCAAPSFSAGWTLTDLGTLGGASSAANGLNNAGQVVGYAEAADGTPYPTIWTGGVPAALSLRPGPGLRIALEDPERADALFLDRVSIAVDDRLRLIAAEESLDSPPMITQSIPSRYGRPGFQ